MNNILVVTTDDITANLFDSYKFMVMEEDAIIIPALMRKLARFVTEMNKVEPNATVIRNYFIRGELQNALPQSVLNLLRTWINLGQSYTLLVKTGNGTEVPIRSEDLYSVTTVASPEIWY